MRPLPVLPLAEADSGEACGRETFRQETVCQVFSMLYSCKKSCHLLKKNSVSELNLGKKVECKKDRRLLARHVGRKKNFIFKSYRTEFGNLFKYVTLGINPRVAEACRGRLILQLLLRNDFAWNIIPVFSLPNRLRKKIPPLLLK